MGYFKGEVVIIFKWKRLKPRMECNAFNFYCDTVSVYLSYFEKKLLNSKEIPEGKETYVY